MDPLEDFTRSLYEYFPDLWAYFRKTYHCRKETFEDIFQDAVLALVERERQSRPVSHPRAFMWKCCRYMIENDGKRYGQRYILTESMAEDLRDEGSGVRYEKLMREVYPYMETRYKRFILISFHGKKLKEIAEYLDLPSEGSARSMKQRIVKALRATFEKNTWLKEEYYD